MATLKKFNLVALNKELADAGAVLAPALAKAGITTIVHQGKTVAASEAPVDSQISALLAAQPVADGAQNAAEAIASNDLISKELDKANTELALKTTAVQTLTSEKAALQSDLAKANATVQDLTVKNSVLTQERDAAVNQFTANSKALTAQKEALAKRCIAANCLILTGKDGKPLDAAATDEAKMEAAMAMPQEDLFKAYNGAVNAAVAKTGVTFAELPSGKPASVVEKKPELTGRARFSAGLKVEGYGERKNPIARN